MLKPTPDPIDVVIGAKVRSARLLSGLSQEKLGAALGVSFQQVQKYESGANRIGASRLQQIAIALKAPLYSFFDYATLPDATAQSLVGDELKLLVAEFLSTGDGVRLLRALREVRNPKTRKIIVDLVVVLAEMRGMST